MTFGGILIILLIIILVPVLLIGLWVIGAYNKQVEIGRTNRANLDRVNDPHRTSVDLKSKHVQLSFFGPTAE